MFQSAPLTEARGDVYAPVYASKELQVSIRSPHRSKGRPASSLAVDSAFIEFQSAPLTEARGDLAGVNAFRASTLFQSAPLTEARGDPSPPLPWPSSAKFQSAPLTEARGDKVNRGDKRRLGGFNPLPSPKQGETSTSMPWATSSPSFNPLPSPKQGETCD